MDPTSKAEIRNKTAKEIVSHASKASASGLSAGDGDVRIVPRSQLTAAEEAELELSKLDL